MLNQIDNITSRLTQFSPVYLVDRFIYRAFIFLRHWFFDSFFAYAEAIIKFLAKIDRVFAIRINFHYLFHPLYQDYTIIGYVLGFVFRSSRIIIGFFAYLLIVIAALFLYLIWLIIPFYLLWRLLNFN